MVPKGVRGPGRPKKQNEEATVNVQEDEDFPRDQDADDVERYAREHGGMESPQVDEERGEKREASGSSEDVRGGKLPPCAAASTGFR